MQLYWRLFRKEKIIDVHTKGEPIKVNFDAICSHVNNDDEKNEGREDSYRKILKADGFITRHPRVKERKKYGLKGARRAPQFSKR